MFIYIYTCLYIYIYIHIYIHTHTYIYIYTFIHVYIYICINVYIYICVYTAFTELVYINHNGDITGYGIFMGMYLGFRVGTMETSWGMIERFNRIQRSIGSLSAVSSHRNHDDQRKWPVNFLRFCESCTLHAVVIFITCLRLLVTTGHRGTEDFGPLWKGPWVLPAQGPPGG